MYALRYHLKMLTESHNFSNQHIGAIKNNRDNIGEQYNVEIKITGKRFGHYQEVEITGFSKDIRKALTALNLVAEQADNDFLEYKQRCKKRRKSNKVSPHLTRHKVEKEKPKTSINPFALLHIEDDEDVGDVGEEDSSSDSGEDFEEISNMKLCWADM